MSSKTADKRQRQNSFNKLNTISVLRYMTSSLWQHKCTICNLNLLVWWEEGCCLALLN